MPDDQQPGAPGSPPERASPDDASVLARISGLTGSMSRITLRDVDADDQTPMLRPLGQAARLAAGKYIVQGEIGRGGVGAVHRGHDQDLGRDVAMKFLHDKYIGERAVLDRFVEEAQIGGQLQHPGIVPVYDLGTVDDKPFFTMKLVKGQTLAKKLSDRASPADQRRTFLSIFEDVCQTMAYAHARGVVHRDLKPANIMIGSFGEVQVVDWGMGKVLQSGGVADERRANERQTELSVIETARSAGQGTHSVIGSVMGTPAYMPPEQARGDVERMDERSDVFALGAILCEILTGQPPYAGAPGDLIEMAANARLDDAHARLAACGAESDLIQLATRCLTPAAAARPRSAEVVARSVHEHLAAAEARVHDARVEAAEARVRAAALKRAQKLGVSLTVVIAVALLVSLWSWRAAATSATAAQQNAQRAVEQSDRAERELARAVEFKRLISEMLESVTPEIAQGADITLLKGILDAASARLNDGSIDDEFVAAELHALVGGVYRELGLYDEAERHLPTAVETATRVSGAEHPTTLKYTSSLASLYAYQGRFAEAELLDARTLEIQKRVLGVEDRATLGTMSNLASDYKSQGRFAEAETLTLETLAIQQRVLGPDHPFTLNNRSNLGLLYQSQGRYAEAEALQRDVTGARARVLGAEDPATLLSWTHVAKAIQSQGRHDEAEALQTRVLEDQRRVLGHEHPQTLASMINLADIYHSEGRAADAEALQLDALEVAKRKLGEAHPFTLASKTNLAIVYQSQGRLAAAEVLHREVYEIQARELGDTHPRTLISMVNLASVYQALGRSPEAASWMSRALDGQRGVLGDDHPHTMRSMSNLAEIYRFQGRLDLAEPVYSELLDLQVAAAERPEADAMALNEAAWSLLTCDVERLRDPKRALPLAERACALEAASGRPDLWMYLDTLALAQHRTGDTAAAVATQRRALSLMPDDGDPEMPARLAEYEAALRQR